MIPLGTGTAKIIRTNVGINGNRKKFLGVQLMIEGCDDAPWVKIYLTEAAKNIAKKKLKMCGFDVETQSFRELEANETMLSGNDVPYIATEEQGSSGIYTKVEIPLPGAEKATPEDLDGLDAMFRQKSEAKAAPKKKAAAPPKASPPDRRAAKLAPAEALLSPEEKAALDKAAEGEDIPF